MAVATSNRQKRGADTMKEELDRLLEAMVQSAEGISDLLFVAGRPLQVEIQGELKPFVNEQSEPVLTSERIESLAGVIINNNQRLLQDLKEHGSCDCGYTLKNACRFRVNVYLQNGNYAMVLRHLKPLIPTFESLHLAPVFHEIIKEKNGLIFVTGGTGMGKTTTIAAMLNEINKTRDIHILTLEDPIEFVFTPIKSTFSQRELGRDFYNFHRRHARRHAAGAQNHFYRRNPRPRNDGDRAQRRRNRPSGFQHAAHHQRRDDHQPHPRHVRHG